MNSEGSTDQPSRNAAGPGNKNTRSKSHLLPTTLRPPTQPESAPPAANREATSEGEIRRGYEGGGGGGGTRKGATVDSPARNRRRGATGLRKPPEPQGRRISAALTGRLRKGRSQRVGPADRGGGAASLDTARRQALLLLAISPCLLCVSS